jgi:SPX domain protein involved in polyphosphate accumulation
MGQGGRRTAVPFAEGDITQLRREFKLVLSPGAADVLRRQLVAEQGGLPGQTAITSVYFDRPGFPLASKALICPEDCLKLRTKEYFPDLSGNQNHVVLEAKRERNGFTQKHRVWLPRNELASVLKEGRGLPGGLVDTQTVLPVLAVTYRRQVFQSQAAFRVTVDTRLTFHCVDGALAFGTRSLSPDVLGQPLFEDDRVIIEVKHLGNELPRWLAELRRRSVRFSKFAEGVTRLDVGQLRGVEGDSLVH